MAKAIAIVLIDERSGGRFIPIIKKIIKEEMLLADKFVGSR